MDDKTRDLLENLRELFKWMDTESSLAEYIDDEFGVDVGSYLDDIDTALEVKADVVEIVGSPLDN